ncbi:MAG: hypothetical protein M1829_004802 [Trizodia sp. TS-e1964]|nr:MAG: hypothetical protein M1829_004802 [Trizodia sp. TS-e1964]
MSILAKLQSRLELFRLEKRYTRRKNRTTFSSHAQYVDGEYIYRDATGGSLASSASHASSHVSSSRGAQQQQQRRVVFGG